MTPASGPLTDMKKQNRGRRVAVRPDPGAWLAEVRHSFDSAAQVSGNLQERTIAIGPHVIRLRFAGPAMIGPFLPAVEHLVIASARVPNLTVLIWDSASTQTPLPPFPWSARDYGARGQIGGYNDGRYFTNYDVEWGLLSMLDCRQALALVWMQDARKTPRYVSGAPLRTVLGWWMESCGSFIVHAAAIGTEQGGALLIGRSGSGKSTTALTALDSDLCFAGDDCCSVSLQSGPLVHSLYNSAKVDPEDLHRTPSLARAVATSIGELDKKKSVFFLCRYFPERIARGFPLQVLLLPRLTNGPETTTAPARAASAFTALAPSTMLLRPGPGPETFRVMCELVSTLPAYHLELGTDMARIPAVIAGLLASLHA